ncbi:MAG: divalent-cation tolerance protein CutA [Elusimicrobia bacterium]|nr:divalent-cation tolerance protein CutA [Elusimicrobiota bacterium]
MDKTFFCVVLTTCPEAEQAKKLARSLVEAKLAGCVTVVPQAISFYHWENKLEETPECMLVIKTRSRSLPSLMRFIKEKHSYSTPEIITLPIVEGDRSYLDWLGANTIFSLR